MSEFVKIEVVTSGAKLGGFKEAMSKIGSVGMTVIPVVGCGVQKGTPEYIDEINEEIALLPKQLILMVVQRDDLDKVLDVIEKELYSGHLGDGKIFVSPIENVIRIRTGEEGEEALV